jgi:sugar lactone lactonase YvrE
VVAGAMNGSSAELVPASTAALASPPAIAFDAAGNLYVADPGDNRVRRIDSTTGRIRTVLGTGTAGALGDYGPAIAAQISSPWALAFDPAGGMVVSEQGNHGLRAVPGLSASVPVAATLSIVAGNPQTAELDQNPGLLFTVKLTDENGAALANYGIAWTAPDPGSALYVTSSRTNPSGKATALGRVGLAPGPYRFQASMTDIFGHDIPGSPVTFTVTAVAPAAGTTFTIVNTDHSAGDDPGPLSGIIGHVGELRGMTRASDGTIYFTDLSHSRVRKLSPQGELTTVAGDGTQGYTGDNGPASRARLSAPQGIVLDEPGQLLYVSDSGNNVIRMIDLSVAVPTITTYAGTGSATPLGNGGPAAAAGFSSPTHLFLRTEGTTPYLYVADFNHGAIRRINRNTTIVTNYFDASTVPSGNGRVTWNSCGYGPAGCSIAWDSSGVPFISGHYFDGTFYNPQGVAKINFTTTPVTATILLGTSDQASTKYLAEPPTLLFNAQNQLLVTDRGASKLNTFDEAGNLIATLAGTGTAGYAGDSVPLSQTQLNHPWMTLLTPEGHLLIEDSLNACIRESF